MRVSGEEYLRVSHLMQVGRRSGDITLKGIATAPARGSSAERGEFSPEAREVQRVVGSIEKDPEIREDVVAGLRERIESGTYRVTGEQIAEMMLRRFLADHVAE